MKLRRRGGQILDAAEWLSSAPGPRVAGRRPAGHPSWLGFVARSPIYPQARIEYVAQPVTKRVEPKHDQSNGDAGDDRRPGINVQKSTPGGDELPQAGQRRLSPQSDEGQAGLCDDRDGA